MLRFSDFRSQIPSFIRRLATALLLVLSVASPALARIAAIETMAPLPDQSEQSIKAAIKEAAETAVRGAMAMGLRWIQVHQVLVLADMVTVQIVATDVEPEREEARELGPDEEREWRPSQGEQSDL